MKIMQEKMVKKSDGNRNIFSIPNPDCYDLEGKFHKRRHKHTNITPKKKKRRK